MSRPDPHSAFDDAQPRVRHLDWRVDIDFAARVLEAEAQLALDGDGELIDLDTRDLTIDRVTIGDGDGAALPFELGPPHPFLGRRLRIHCGSARRLRIHYRTSPHAAALQWLNHSVYSQCQTIQARTLVPLPDSPSVRLTVRAALTAPRASTVLMGGELIERTKQGDHATTRYAMVEPIAPYLLALAVGDFAGRELSPRIRVWSAPALLDEAVRALGGVARILDAAEQLLGPYRWGRFDLWLAPSSFPYGGMENPRLAFLSPSLLSEDGTIENVVAHELAHAWFGNLVGSASAEHFWLNEGFAVYVERRLAEALDGIERVRMQSAIGRRDLDRALAAFAARPELTRLRTHLDGIDPDEALSIVPYEKGYLLLCALETHLGRASFDRWLRDYLERFAGSAITSELFATFAAATVPGFPFDEWLNQSGLPAGVAAPPAGAVTDELPARDEAARWSSWQWRWYLDGLPRPSSLCATLDEWFNLSKVDDAEVRAAWLPLAIASDYAPVLATIETALDAGAHRGGGRIKLLRPVYLALARSPATRDRVGGWWRRFRDGYHPVARQQLDRLLRELGIATQDVNPLSLRRRS